MGVDVDDAGGEHPPLGINYLARGVPDATDLDDASVRYAHIGVDERRAAAIGDPRSLDKKIEQDTRSPVRRSEQLRRPARAGAPPSSKVLRRSGSLLR